MTDAIETAARGGDVGDLDFEQVPELAALQGCPQTAVHHGEGDVAVHSRLVYDLAREHAERLATEDVSASAGSGTAAAAGDDGTDPRVALEQVAIRLAGLLHDLGKPVTTRASGPGKWSARGHDLAGAELVSSLFATHPALMKLPLGVYPSVHGMVRAHMWTYAGERISAGAALRLSHVSSPDLLKALWDSDSRGRICDDAADLADQVAFAALMLAEHDAARPDSFGPLDEVADRASVPARAWREAFRALVTGSLHPDPGAVTAHLAAAERRGTGGSITYTIGLPGAGKSTWARETWAPSTDGMILSSTGGRRHDRRAVASDVLSRIPQQLAAGRDICLDATHLLRETRDVLVTCAGRYGAALHAVYFRAPLSLALHRQATRPDADAVPAATITKMASSLRFPTPDEYQTLTIVEPDGRTWPYTAQSRWLTRAS